MIIVSSLQVIQSARNDMSNFLHELCTIYSTEVAFPFPDRFEYVANDNTIETRIIVIQ